MMTTSSLSETIRKEALRLGFIDCGFSKVRPLTEHEPKYQDWLQQGHHASMDYMTRNTDKRIHPALLVDNAKTVISLLYNYYTSAKLEGSPLKIAKYAYGKDYHDVIKNKMRALDRFMKEQAGEVTQRCFVDSAPVLERAWAQNSGLGWIGKNSCLISRKHGSFFFIAEIITTLDLDHIQSTIKDYCGSCQKCIDACPTKAITVNRTINSNLCISFHTIENKGDIPSALKGKFEGFIFGCDICQDVCPWNRKAIPNTEALFNLTDGIREMSTEHWVALDEEKYRKMFKGSPVKRTKFTGLKRNIYFSYSDLQHKNSF
jgi:epoxyqueuosine reductase